MLDSWNVHKAKSIQRSKDLLRVLRCEAMLESKEGGPYQGVRFWIRFIHLPRGVLLSLIPHKKFDRDSRNLC